MTVQITLGVPKGESEEAQLYPETWDSLATQIAAMIERGETVDIPHEGA
jgi:hypothetical protein